MKNEFYKHSDDKSNENCKIHSSPDFVTLKILNFYLLDTELFVSLCHPNLGDTE